MKEESSHQDTISGQMVTVISLRELTAFFHQYSLAYMLDVNFCTSLSYLFSAFSCGVVTVHSVVQGLDSVGFFSFLCCILRVFLYARNTGYKWRKFRTGMRQNI